MNKGYIIAIDGPVASGKGTIAQICSKTIGAFNFNSGGIYRAYAYRMQALGIPPEKESEIFANLYPGEADIEINSEEKNEYSIVLNGTDITDELFTPEISMAASNFGKSHAFVEFINSELRRIAKRYQSSGEGIIMEGRQIGVNVFPDAEVKIFLTADLQTRAKRRFEQYKAKNINLTLEEVVKETHQRDEQDMNRKFGALPRHPEKLGYDIIDNSKLSEQETVDVILTILEKKGIWKKI